MHISLKKGNVKVLRKSITIYVSTICIKKTCVETDGYCFVIYTKRYHAHKEMYLKNPTHPPNQHNTLWPTYPLIGHDTWCTSYYFIEHKCSTVC